ncbi:MAG: hypothetical protein LBU89_10215 [Fibromonadaceae bacterium]|jgi:uncharacterized protein (TIGR02145 family)|nr:hypothetical protein [Fibromonadaceae bacterium]
MKFPASVILLVVIFTFSCYNEEHICGGQEHVKYLCGYAEYDPAVQKCDDGFLLNPCGTVWYKPTFSEYCFEGQVKEKEIYIDSRDGREYKTVVIGTQTWMAENLNYAAYGSKCGGTGGSVYSSTLFYDENTEICDKYGRLYDWATAMTVCPDGWRLPSDDDWTLLTNYAGGDSVAGRKLKATSDWILSDVQCVPFGRAPLPGADYISCGISGTDDYGFSALPGGHGSSHLNRYYGFLFGCWWSSTTEYSYPNSARYLSIDYESSYTNRRFRIGREDFLSVRCVKDFYNWEIL